MTPHPDMLSLEGRGPQAWHCTAGADYQHPGTAAEGPSPQLLGPMAKDLSPHLTRLKPRNLYLRRRIEADSACGAHTAVDLSWAGWDMPTVADAWAGQEGMHCAASHSFGESLLALRPTHR